MMMMVSSRGRMNFRWCRLVERLQNGVDAEAEAAKESGREQSTKAGIEGPDDA